MQKHERSDITTAADIDHLIEVFYARVLNDPIIGFFFTDIAKINLEKHLPVISAFWQLQLLGTPGYRGQTLAKHADIHQRAALTADHFHRWLYLFAGTIDQLFAGPCADLAKTRANKIAQSMLRGLNERQGPPTEIKGLHRAHRTNPAERDE